MKKILLICLFIFTLLSLEARRNIMLTGYWSPTSEMIYRFSDDPELNPDGWIGENWEDRGFDVYAFFPAFNRETRDFEVDYQATWEDFWATVEIVNPVAIISYGAGSGPWEIEYNARNLSYWVNDYEYPYQPTPCPPDSTVAVNFVRHSTLPVSEIEAAVDEQTPINAWVDWNGNPGMFLCEYMAYLGMWYQDMHSSIEDEYTCLSAGFIHVNSGVNLTYATEAAEVTLRTTIEFLNSYVELNGTVYAPGVNPAGTEINFISESGQAFTAEADETGSFSIELMPAGLYSIEAYLDRYYYYSGEAYIDSLNSEIEIELQEYPALEPLTWCSGEVTLAELSNGINLIIASVFTAEDLAPYVNCHLREITLKSPADSSECDLDLILYEGTPQSGEPMLILEEQTLSGFSTGEDISVWLDDLNILSENCWETGITLAFQVNSQTGAIGWLDNEPAVEGKGNLIKLSGNWIDTNELLGCGGNWDMSLGFYGEAVTDNDNVTVVPAARLYNYPNPFNPETHVSFFAPDETEAQLSIYNIKGELVYKAVQESNNNGRFEWVWQGKNESGRDVSSGIYLMRVKAGNLQSSKKTLLLK